MSEFFNAMMAFPTVVFTIPLGLALLYWLFVIFGAVDIDMFSGGDGALEGAAGKIDAAADGIFEGAAGKVDAAADGIFEGAAGKVDAAADGIFEGAAGKVDAAADGVFHAAAGKAGAADGLFDGVEGGDGGALDVLLSVFNLRRAPVTIVFSCISFIGWILASVATNKVLPMMSMAMPHWLAGLLIVFGVLLLAIPLTSLITKPLEKVFREQTGKRRRDFVGTVCRIRTGTIDDRYGQASVEDGGAGLIIQVRGDTKLKRGERALIVDYDREREAYIVEAYDALLEEEAQQKARR